MLKAIKSKKYWIATTLLIWLLFFFFSLFALLIYTIIRNAFQVGFYTVSLLLLTLTAVGLVLLFRIDKASKIYPLSWIAFLLILFGISCYFAVNLNLLLPEEVDLIFKFSISFSFILVILILVIAFFMKRKLKSAYELLEELKNRS